MTLEQVLDILEAKLVSSDPDLSTVIDMACGADLMSDVLAFTHVGTLLLSGLINPQVIRTAEMAGIVAIVFVRGKIPPPETIALAESMSIPLMATRHTLYESCGRLYSAGLQSCGDFELSSRSWNEAKPG